MKYQTGNMVVAQYTKRDMACRAIELMGGITHHNELMRAEDDDVKCLYARPPVCSYISFEDRKLQYAMGDLNMAVYRHVGLSLVHTTYDRSLAQIAASLDTMARLRLPYDKTAILSFARNWLRQRWGLARRVLSQHEHDVWCTESCDIALDCAGINMLEGIPAQPMPAPIHVERCIRAGTWDLVADYGLHEKIMTGESK